MRIIAGTYKNRILVSPKGQETRPTSALVRESVFNICQTYIEGTRFLDLFAGSGAMGIEALSRGAAQATFIEQNLEAIKCIERNIATLDLKSKTKLMRGEVFKILKRETIPYDIVYADPPYDQEVFEGLLQFFDTSNLIAPGGDLFIEQRADQVEESFSLETLVFKNRRKLGAAALYLFQKKPE